MRRQMRTAGFVLSTILAIASPAAADVIADWNICAQPLIATGRATILYGAGPSTQLDLAMMHLAMHDAIQAYDHRYESYAGAITGGNGSAAAAAARAAHTLLSNRIPSQQTGIDACYTSSMLTISVAPEQLADSNTVGN